MEHKFKKPNQCHCQKPYIQELPDLDVKVEKCKICGKSISWIGVKKESGDE